MLSVQRERRRFTPEEETSQTRNEFYDGDIFAMTAGTLNHNRIYRALSSALEGGPCRVHNLFPYPDLMGIRGPLPLMPGRKDTLMDARMVLSPSTESFDRTDRFRMDRSLPSLQVYVLVAQDRLAVERHQRLASEGWEDKESQSLQMDSLQLLLPPGQSPE